MWNTKVNDSNIVIGGVVGGWPSSENTSLISVLASEFKQKVIPVKTTARLAKHMFNINLEENTKASFDFVDAQVFFFDPNDDPLLKRYISGVADDSNFLEPDTIISYPPNALTHVVLGINARQLLSIAPVEPVQTGWFSWFSSWFSSTAKRYDGIDKNQILNFLLLYNQIEKILGTRYKHPEARIAVLITHMDMIPDEMHEELRKTIGGLFHRKVPENFYFYGSKECTWNDDDLLAHDLKMKKIWNNNKSPSQYFSAVSEELKKDPHFSLDVPANLCTKHKDEAGARAEHPFTPRTIKCFKSIIIDFLR